MSMEINKNITVNVDDETREEISEMMIRLTNLYNKLYAIRNDIPTTIGTIGDAKRVLGNIILGKPLD